MCTHRIFNSCWVSQSFPSNLGYGHCKSIKKVLRFLRGTLASCFILKEETYVCMVIIMGTGVVIQMSVSIPQDMPS